MDCAVPYGRVRMSHECETLFATTLVSAFCVLITPPFDFIFVLLLHSFTPFQLAAVLVRPCNPLRAEQKPPTARVWFTTNQQFPVEYRFDPRQPFLYLSLRFVIARNAGPVR